MDKSKILFLLFFGVSFFSFSAFAEVSNEAYREREKEKPAVKFPSLLPTEYCRHPVYGTSDNEHEYQRLCDESDEGLAALDAQDSRVAAVPNWVPKPWERPKPQGPGGGNGAPAAPKPLNHSLGKGWSQ